MRTEVEVTFTEIVHETDPDNSDSGAYLIEFESGIEKWLPKSQCILNEKTIEIPEWLAIEHELDAYII